MTLELELMRPGDGVHIVPDIRKIETVLLDAGIPAPTLTREMLAIAEYPGEPVVCSVANVKKTVSRSQLGPYYELNVRHHAYKRGWEPQWAAPYTVEWWQQIGPVSLTDAGDFDVAQMPKFQAGSLVRLIPKSLAEERASSIGYDISGMGAYVPPAGAVGELRRIVSVDHGWDAMGRVTYMFHLERSSFKSGLFTYVESLRVITSFFFQEFWDAMYAGKPTPPRLALDDDDNGITIEN